MNMIIEAPVSERTREIVANGYARWENATRTHGQADEWDNAVIDQAIKAFVLAGKPFSVNDCRPLLPPVRKCLISRRFIEAQKAGWLVPTGYTPSTLPSTHGHPVRVYTPLAAARRRLIRSATVPGQRKARR